MTTAIIPDEEPGAYRIRRYENRVAQRHKLAAQRKVIADLQRRPKFSSFDSLAEHRAYREQLLKEYRRLAHLLIETVPCYRPDSATQQAMLGEHTALNIVVAHMEKELRGATGGA